MQQVKISDLRENFRRCWLLVMRGTPLEVLSHNAPVGVLVRSADIELAESARRVSRSELRAELTACCDGFLEGVSAYAVTYHGRVKTAFVSPEFARGNGVYGEANQ